MRGSIEEREMRYHVSLVLARSREFPLGNSRCRYQLVLPLKDDCRLDLGAWSRRRTGNRARRFSLDLGEAWGQLRHDRQGWFLSFGHGEASEEAYFAEADGSFALGEAIPIVEWDGQIRVYRVSALAPEHLDAGKAA
jgi:hypothetical protein